MEGGHGHRCERGVEVMAFIIRRRFLTAVLPIVIIGGCTYLPEYVDPIDWADSANEWVTGNILGEDEISETGPLARSDIPGEEDPFPSLTSVPDDRPSIRTLTEREEIANELVADRIEARYDDMPSITSSAPVSPVTNSVSAQANESRTSVMDGREIGDAEATSDVTVIEDSWEESAPRIDEKYIELTEIVPQKEFVIPPPTVPEVPPWSSVEDNFEEMFRASGGAGSLMSVRGSTVFPEEDISVSTLETGLSRVHAAVIYFNHGSTMLSNKHKKILREVAVAVARSDGYVSVVGHASSRTKTNDVLRHNVVNYETSLARAESVAAELIFQGVPRDKVSVYAMGDDQPDYSEATTLGEAANRRANVYVDF